MNEVYEGRGTSYAALGIEGFAILLDAMNRCDDPADKACVNRMIRSTAGFEGLLGHISIDLEGKAQRPLVINVINNGTLENAANVY